MVGLARRRRERKRTEDLAYPAPGAAPNCRRAIKASRTGPGTIPVISPPSAQTSFTSELEMWAVAGSPGKKRVSMPLRCLFIVAIGIS